MHTSQNGRLKQRLPIGFGPPSALRPDIPEQAMSNSLGFRLAPVLTCGPELRDCPLTSGPRPNSAPDTPEQALPISLNLRSSPVLTLCACEVGSPASGLRPHHAPEQQGTGMIGILPLEAYTLICALLHVSAAVSNKRAASGQTSHPAPYKLTFWASLLTG